MSIHGTRKLRSSTVNAIAFEENCDGRPLSSSSRPFLSMIFETMSRNLPMMSRGQPGSRVIRPISSNDRPPMAIPCSKMRDERRRSRIGRSMKEVIGRATSVSGRPKSIDGEGSWISGRSKSIDGQRTRISGRPKSIDDEGTQIPCRPKSIDGEGTRISGRPRSIDGEGTQILRRPRSIDGPGMSIVRRPPSKRSPISRTCQRFSEIFDPHYKSGPPGVLSLKGRTKAGHRGHAGGVT